MGGGVCSRRISAARGVCSRGVSPPGGVCSQGSVCSGGCLLRGMSAPVGCLLPGVSVRMIPPYGTHPTGIHSCSEMFPHVVTLLDLMIFNPSDNNTAEGQVYHESAS